MVYETSYESGRRPFFPDTKRGYWANPNDFIYAGLGLAFRLDLFSMVWFFSAESTVVAVVPVYIFTLLLCIIPFLVIQAFLGQFSSSGYISAFRLTPLFKGVGYVTLALNICVLSYYSIFAMVPLVYMFASMQPTLPWSCEGFKKWATNLTEEEETNLCNLYVQNETDIANSSISIFVNHHIPSVLYFKTLFNDLNLFSYDDVDFSMSWQLILCAILVWAIVVLIFYKGFNTERFSQIVRYTVWTLCGLLVLFLIRFSFLPGAGHVYHRVAIPTGRNVLASIASIPVYALSAFGPGWGLFVSLSSFNKFKTNIMRQSWIIGFGQMAIIIGIDLLTNLIEIYFNEVTDGNYYTNVEHVWVLYLSSGSTIAHMAWANFWSILFYFMLFLAAILLIIIQLYTITTTIFDEFVTLRERKMEVCMGLIAVIASLSLYFTSNHGVTYFTALSTDTYITQAVINLLLILIVLWIYGRVRFQRDIEFMINERFSTWKINILRFATPLVMLLALLVGLFAAYYEHVLANGIIAVFAVIFIVLPWILIPGHAVYILRQSMGSFKTRFQRCSRPNDWYPVEQEDRQRYEEAMGNMDITHQLNDITDNDVL